MMYLALLHPVSESVYIREAKKNFDLFLYKLLYLVIKIFITFYYLIRIDCVLL